MNITLREVYQTSADGDRFWKLKECYIRGSTVSVLLPSLVRSSTLIATALGWRVSYGVRVVWRTRHKIKYLRVPDTLLDAVKEEQARAREVGRSARGAGPGPRGTPSLLYIFIYIIFCFSSLITILHDILCHHAMSDDTVISISISYYCRQRFTFPQPYPDLQADAAYQREVGHSSVVRCTFLTYIYRSLFPGRGNTRGTGPRGARGRGRG